MRLGELLPGSRIGYLRWAPLSPVKAGFYYIYIYIYLDPVTLFLSNRTTFSRIFLRKVILHVVGVFYNISDFNKILLNVASMVLKEVLFFSTVAE